MLDLEPLPTSEMELFLAIAIVAKNSILDIGSCLDTPPRKHFQRNLQVAATAVFENPMER